MVTYQKQPFPYKFDPLVIDSDNDVMNEFFKDRITVGPRKYCLKKEYINLAPVLYNFEVRPDDVWIVGHPRSGTTVSTELVWLLCNDLDYKTASEVILQERVPYFELSINKHQTEKAIEWTKLKDKSIDYRTVEAKSNHQKLADRKGRRIIKAHLPFSLLPPDLISSGCKIFYLARNPKDVAVSSYYWVSAVEQSSSKLTLSQYYELFFKGQTSLAPQLEHVKEGWDQRHANNILFVFYEELNKDLTQTIKNYAEFLEKDLTACDLAKLVEHLRFENFRKNNSVNNQHLYEAGILNEKDVFIRKGKVGGYKESVNEELIKMSDDVIRNFLVNTDLQFPE